MTTLRCQHPPCLPVGSVELNPFFTDPQPSLPDLMSRLRQRLKDLAFVILAGAPNQYFPPEAPFCTSERTFAPPWWANNSLLIRPPPLIPLPFPLQPHPLPESARL